MNWLCWQKIDIITKFSGEDEWGTAAFSNSQCRLYLNTLYVVHVCESFNLAAREYCATLYMYIHCPLSHAGTVMG